MPVVIRNARETLNAGTVTIAALPAILTEMVRGDLEVAPGCAAELCGLLRSMERISTINPLGSLAAPVEMFAPGRDEAIELDILELLRRHGEGSAADPVGRILKRGRTGRVRTKAAEILPVLKERLRIEQEPKVLLRPSGPPEDSPGELLRPAVSTADRDPSMLLRAEAGETPEG